MKKWLHVTMPGGSRYRIPVSVIVRHRASKLAREQSKLGRRTYGLAYTSELDAAERLTDTELVTWAREQMIWNDVADHAVAIQTEDENRYNGWSDGELVISSSPMRVV